VARYALRFDERAREDLRELSPDIAERIVRRLGELEDAPEPRGDTVKRLKGFAIPTSRFRVGDYRAIFRVSGTVVVILRVVHRSQLDRALRDLG
jgi:mRNA-degrading endonuclease RelE of RelBE toxin-antitoxin system